MKIAVSSTGKEMTSALDPRFGRCAYFAIHDTDTDDTVYVENAGASATGGAGIAASQQIIDKDVDAVITGAMGPNAFRGINASGIKVYKCGSVDIATALSMLADGKLDSIDAAGRAHAGM